MASLRPSKRAFTLIELMIVIVTSSIIMLTAGSIMVSHVIYFRQFMSEVKLQQESLYIMERLRDAVAGSEQVDITPDTPPALKTYDRNSVLTDDFTLSGTTLTHDTFNANGTINTTESVSNCIWSLTFSDSANPSNQSAIRTLGVVLQTKDPSVTSAIGPTIATALSCRLTPVLNVGVVQNMTLSGRLGNPALYNTIQAAISDPQLQLGDEIRCKGDVRSAGPGHTFDGIFRENVSIYVNKFNTPPDNIILRGSYDDTFTTQSTTSTPTTIQGNRGAQSVVSCSGAVRNFTIDGFRIQNGGTVYPWGQLVQNGGGISVRNTGSGPLTVNISNNYITNNYAVLGGGISIYKDEISGGNVVSRALTSVITNNTITQNTARDSTLNGITTAGQGGGIYIYNQTGNIWGTPTSTSVITHNTITSNLASQGGGISVSVNYPCSHDFVSIVTNNNISNNQAVRGQGGGIAFTNLASSAHLFESIISNNIIASNICNTSGSGIYGYLSSQGVTGGYPPRAIITGNSISSNTGAAGGGGIYIEGIPGQCLIDNNDIESNSCTEAGGGICLNLSNMAGEIVRVARNTIKLNTQVPDTAALNSPYYSTSFGFGGGMGITVMGTNNVGWMQSFSILDNFVYGNSADLHGGGIYFVNYPGSDQTKCSQITSLVMTNNVIATNTAHDSLGGGGAEFFFSNGVLPGYTTFENDTITNNSVGGLLVVKTTYSCESFLTNWGSIRNMICYGNLLPSLNFQLPFTAPTPCYSDIDGSGYGAHPDTTKPDAGGNIDALPLFNPANSNYSLLPSSPCIDTGDGSAQFNDTNGSRNDMGAYGGPNGGIVGYHSSFRALSSGDDPENYTAGYVDETRCGT